MMRAAFAVVVLLATVAVAGTPKARPKPKPKHEPAAVVFVVDRSQQMSDNRLAAVTESILAAVTVLDASDRFAVVAFDTSGVTIVPPRPASERASPDELRLASGGDARYAAGLREAGLLLEGERSKRRHIILVAGSPSPDDAVGALAKGLHDESVTISTVGLPHADRDLLSAISDAGEGRLYMVEDVGALPKILMREATDAAK